MSSAQARWTLQDTLALLGAGRPEWSLTADQRAAVGAPLEPGLILAGAGSGKTEVMAARVVHLVASRQVRPEEVLGLTFTTKATASLAARVRAGLERLRQLAASGSAAPLSLAELDGEPIVLTYNGYGARLLADHGLRIGVEPQARLAPEGLRWQLAMSVVRRWAGPLEVDLLPVSVAERIRQLADEMSSHLTTTAAIRDGHAKDAGDGRGRPEGRGQGSGGVGEGGDPAAAAHACRSVREGEARCLAAGLRRPDRVGGGARRPAGGRCGRAHRLPGRAAR